MPFQPIRVSLKRGITICKQQAKVLILVIVHRSKVFCIGQSGSRKALVSAQSYIDASKSSRKLLERLESIN